MQETQGKIVGINLSEDPVRDIKPTAIIGIVLLLVVAWYAAGDQGDRMRSLSTAVACLTFAGLLVIFFFPMGISRLEPGLALLLVSSQLLCWLAFIVAAPFNFKIRRIFKQLFRGEIQDEAFLSLAVVGFFASLLFASIAGCVFALTRRA